MYISIRTVQREAWKKGGAVEKIKRGCYKLIPSTKNYSNTFNCTSLVCAYKAIKTWNSEDEKIAKKLLKKKGYISYSKVGGVIKIKNVNTNETLEFAKWEYVREWAEGV